METKNKIYPFTILIIIGLGIQMVNLIFSVLNIGYVFIIIVQVLGNVTFGIGLLGYFIHIKQNNLLKWTSLVLGILSILNLDSINNLLSYSIKNFNLYDLLRLNAPVISVSIYVVLINLIFVGYAFSFHQLSRMNFLVSLFTRLFIMFKSGYLAITLIGLYAINYIKKSLDIDFNEFLFGVTGTIINLIATGLLLGTFIVLFVLQTKWDKDIKITHKDPNFLD